MDEKNEWKIGATTKLYLDANQMLIAEVSIQGKKRAWGWPLAKNLPQEIKMEMKGYERTPLELLMLRAVETAFGKLLGGTVKLEQLRKDLLKEIDRNEGGQIVDEVDQAKGSERG